MNNDQIDLRPVACGIISIIAIMLVVGYVCNGPRVHSHTAIPQANFDYGDVEDSKLRTAQVSLNNLDVGDGGWDVAWDIWTDGKDYWIARGASLADTRGGTRTVFVSKGEDGLRAQDFRDPNAKACWQPAPITRDQMMANPIKLRSFTVRPVE